tara:strand:- start:1556 stop:1783 length:228 start_codon:yes stop_codon:yes gene_type:complete
MAELNAIAKYEYALNQLSIAKHDITAYYFSTIMELVKAEDLGGLKKLKESMPVGDFRAKEMVFNAILDLECSQLP